MSDSPHLSFLDLPLAIRQRIYEHLIPDDEFQCHTKSLARQQYSQLTECDKDCRCLLLTCRLIYNELAPTVYSTKHFIDQYRNSRLQGLQKLTPTAIQSLVKLTIFINNSTCEPGWPCCKEGADHAHHVCKQHDEPLRSMSPHCEVISEWYRTVDHLAPYIQPYRLKLYFICDVADMSAAIAAVTPFLSRSLPILAECNIRLSEDIDPLMQDLTYKAAKQSMGYSIDESTTTKTNAPFPFFSLPTELRHQILQHTDLVTPYHQVDWNPHHGYYLHYGVKGCDWICDPADHHGCQFRQCWKILDYNGCFCSRYHSAFFTHCRCWRPPTPLFLVCKALRDEAQEVFFVHNRFIIAPADGYGEPAKTVLGRFEASIFLHDIIPTRFLPRLRFLEIVFPPVDEEYLSPRGPELHDWDNLLDDMKNKLDLPNLTLRIYFADFYTVRYATPFRKQLTRKEGLPRVVGAYMHIIRPIEKWKANCFDKLFVHAAWPWSWTREGRNTRVWKQHIVQNDVSVIECRLERRAMGEEYDSVRLGKHDLEKSQWLQAHERSEQFASVLGYGYNVHLGVLNIHPKHSLVSSNFLRGQQGSQGPSMCRRKS